MDKTMETTMMGLYRVWDLGVRVNIGAYRDYCGDI